MNTGTTPPPAPDLDLEPVAASSALLTAGERERILYSWNATERPYHLDQCLHALVEATVARVPDAVAVIADDPAAATSDAHSLTYAELDRRAAYIARRLRQHGVSTETPVGLCAERSLEMVIAMLGILKAGGAYMPLDPAYPAERLALMLADARPPVVLVQPHLVDRLPPNAAAQILLDGAYPAEDQPQPRATTSPDQLAYVIYTSGSTGTPKGVAVSHRSIVNRLLWGQEADPLEASDRVLQKTPVSFDVSLWEFFWPLSVGACLVMAMPEGHTDPEYLVDVIARQQITTIHFVPSVLSLFLEAPDFSRCGSLRRVMCSGEALPLALQQRFFARFDVPLYNLYGPTEAAVEVTAWTCQRDSDRAAVPIGMPIANTQMYVLNDQMQPTPAGVPGELYIGGVQVARGYFNRPALTAERFIPDPYSHTPGARLYKTGDLARFHLDGAIEYLGRVDFQVKIRGVRVELGEIETVLSQAPGVRDAVVLAQDRDGEMQLVAYVVLVTASQQEPAVIEDLRGFLKSRLPIAMIPAAFVLLERLPINPNGKADRAALAKLNWVEASRRTPFVAPRTPLEEALLGMWQEACRLSHISVDDNFFDLGGNSLGATQIVSRVQKTFHIHLTVRDILAAPTVEALARHLLARERQPGQLHKVAVALKRVWSMSPAERQRMLQQKKGKGDI